MSQTKSKKTVKIKKAKKKVAKKATKKVSKKKLYFSIKIERQNASILNILNLD